MLSDNFIYVQDQVEHIVDSPFFKLHPFFVVLFWGMLIYIILMISIPLLTILANLIRSYYKKDRSLITERYKEIIFKYLSLSARELPLFEEKNGKLRKEILLDIIYELVRYVDGEDRSRLRLLFDDLKLERYILKRINSPFCFRKGYYLERLVVLSNINSFDIPLRKMLNSHNTELRLYAMEAFMTAYPDGIKNLFMGYKYDLSLWEQINLYNFFITRNIKIPDFHPLALSSNDSVALFAIRMVRMFKQKQGSIVGYESLLEHPNLEVRFEMFRGLAEFGYGNLDQLFPDFMDKMPLQIRMHIITYLSRTPQANTTLLMRYFAEAEDPEFRIHVLYCIYNFIQGGKSDIEHFASQKEDKILHDLSVHLITNVL